MSSSSTPDLDREVQQIHRGNGDEAIELTGDRRLKFKARTKGGGRGPHGNRVVLDRRCTSKAVHMGALVPTLRAVADPQLVFAGSAGMADSHVWRAQRDRGREGGDESLAWFEWASDAEPGAAPRLTARTGSGSRAARSTTTTGCAGATGARRRITLETLHDDRRTMPVEEYARETLGWWDPPAEDEDAAVFTEPQWMACADVESAITGRLAFGLDVAPDGERATICVAGTRSDGLVHVEHVDSGPGADWVRRASPHCGGSATSRSTIRPRRRACPTSRRRRGVAADQDPRAPADLRALHNLVEAARTAACVTATRECCSTPCSGRRSATSATRGRGRAKATSDITPLYAATLALWALSTKRQPLTTEQLLKGFY